MRQSSISEHMGNMGSQRPSNSIYQYYYDE